MFKSTQEAPAADRLRCDGPFKGRTHATEKITSGFGFRTDTSSLWLEYQQLERSATIYIAGTGRVYSSVRSGQTAGKGELPPGCHTFCQSFGRTDRCSEGQPSTESWSGKIKSKAILCVVLVRDKHGPVVDHHREDA